MINTAKSISIARRDHYNRLKQSDGTMPCTIYLLAHSSLNIVKIGITTNLNKRTNNISRDFGSVEIIKAIETTHNLASSLEIKMLHHFKSYCKVQPTGDGRTEWFDACITDEALEMLDY